MTILFISDLHIDCAHEAITERFLRFVHEEAAGAEALYILGDFFEAWIGDDDPDADQQRAIDAVRFLVTRGVRCYLMHGNRDFLIGSRFCEMTRAEILTDPLLLNVYGQSVLVMHGDALCTDDASYQRLRATVRDPAWQARFSRLSIPQRRTLAAAARSGSRAHTANLEYDIADVNPKSVEAVFRAAGTDLLLHGHTHRPAIHRLQVDGRECTRIVLGDWHERGSVLRWNARGYELATLYAGVPE